VNKTDEDSPKGVPRPGDPYLTFVQLGEEIARTNVVYKEVDSVCVAVCLSMHVFWLLEHRQ
jgi:hypothetical protein